MEDGISLYAFFLIDIGMSTVVEGGDTELIEVYIPM